MKNTYFKTVSNVSQIALNKTLYVIYIASHIDWEIVNQVLFLHNVYYFCRLDVACMESAIVILVWGFFSSPIVVSFGFVFYGNIERMLFSETGSHLTRDCCRASEGDRTN